MKKIVALLFVLISFSIHADIWREPNTGIIWAYRIINGKASVGGGSYGSPAISQSTTGAVTIPSTLGGCPVTSIGSYAFSGCSGLKSITIPGGVTSIDYYAFEGCSGLTSVTIPSSVTSIGECAFRGCSGLMEFIVDPLNKNYSSINGLLCSKNGKALLFGINVDVTIPDGVTSIRDSAFYNCSKLKSLTIPSSVMSIERYAFSGCSGLTSVTIPSSVTSVSDYAFSDCSGLMEFIVNPLNKNYSSINGLLCSKDGKMLLFGINGDVTIPKGVMSIGNGAFSGRSGFTLVTIPSSVTSIGYRAFSGCSELMEFIVDSANDNYCSINGLLCSKNGSKLIAGVNGDVTIPSSVTGIDYYAFEGCSWLTSVTIPSSVTSIGDSAFHGCSGLKSVTIPSSVKNIGDYAFRGCSGLTSITIQEGVTSIGNYAFRGCSGLTSVTIPSSVTRIGDAFSGCNGLTAVTILEGVTSIGSSAFSGCIGLTSITIPSSVISIGSGAFSGCSGITSVTIPACVTRLSNTFFDAYNKIKEVVICEGVESIGSGAFSYCSGLTSVTIPEGVTSIGYDAFYGCSGLTSVTIPSSVTSIGSYAFSGCSELTSITIPEGVTSIGGGAFSGCSGLISVTIPASVTSIDYYAFEGCSGLVAFSVNKNNSLFSTRNGLLCSKDGKTLLYGVSGKVVIPNCVTTIDSYAFYGYNGLASVIIPSSVTSIGSYAFSGCSGLTSITIQEGVTRIGGSAFEGCSGLTSVTIPSSVTSIGEDAFYNCSGLEEVHINDIAAWCKISFGDSTANPLWYAHKLYLGNQEVTDLVIPEGVTSIGSCAFEYCSGLTSVTIPSSVTSIGKCAFRECYNLESIIIPLSVTTIGEGAFPAGCKVIRQQNATVNINCIEDSYVYNGLAHGWYEITCDKPNALSGICFSKIVDPIRDVGEYQYKLSAEDFQNTNIEYVVTFVVERDVCDISIVPREVIVTSSTCEKMYDGELLTCNNYTIVGDGFVNGECAVSVSGVQTNVGSSPNNVTLEWAKDALSLNYDVTINEGTLTVLPAKVVKDGEEPGDGVKPIGGISKYDMTYKYDGEGHTINIEALNKVALVADTPSFSYSLTRDGQYQAEPIYFTNAGITSIWYKVSAPNYEDFVHGAKITILPRKVTLTSKDESKIYDGAPLVGNEVVDVDGDGFVDGECKACAIGAQTNVGSSPNTISLEWADGALASNYDVTINEGTLTVLKRAVSVTSESATKVYDGKPLVAKVSVGGDGFVDGECIVTSNGAQTNVGSSSNAISFEWVDDALASNYDLTINEGTLTVLPAKIAEDGKEPGDGVRPIGGISQYDMTYKYDGEGHTINVDALSGVVLTADTPSFSYSLTRDGQYQAVPIYFTNAGVTSIWYKVSAPNYEDFVHEAKITILPREVALTSKDESKFYDGTPFVGSGTVDVGGDEFADGEGVQIIPTGYQLDEGESVNSFDYVFNYGTLEKNYKITKQFGTLSVTRLYGTLDASHKSIAEAFPYSYVSMTNAVIAEGFSSISADMFAGCVSLKSVELPDSLIDVDNDVFDALPNFEWQIIDGYKFCDGWLFGYESDAAEEVPEINSIRGIANGALEDCQSIKRVIFDEATDFRNIGACTFKNCAALSEVQLPLAVTNIADEAFLNCAALKAFIVPGNVKRIGDRAFKTCSSMERAMLEYGIESIGEETFYDCWRISEVDIPSTVTDIGDNAFGGDSSIIRIGIRPDIKPIKKIFSNYEYIREAVVKVSDTAIDGCFEGCKQLNAVRFLGNCPQMDDGGENFYAGTDTFIHKNDDGSAVTNVNNLVTYVGATSIGWNTPGSQARADVALPQAWPWTGKHRKPISIWDLPTYLCQFDSNGGTLGVQDTYQYSEQKFALPPEPVQSGYKFAGWWTQPVGGLRVTSDTIFIEGVYTKLFAHWIKGHWVFLDPNGGEVVNDFITYMEETTYGVLPTPVRSGYAFGGWMYNGQLITPETTIMEATDHTIIAQWTANLYSVRYHANGGFGDMNDDDYIYGVAKALRKNTFIRNGYVFAGWATESGGTVKYNDGESVENLTTTANGYVDLYAVWEVNDVDEPSNIELFFGGDANWVKLSQGVNVSDGDVVGKYDTIWQSGKIEDNQVSLMKATVNGRGTIGFWWKASCEQFRNLKLDYLEFSIDGTAREPWINGETEWMYVEFEIEETGSHELCWIYAKDEEGSDYDDCGTVTGIRWTPKMSTIAEFVNCGNLIFTTSGDAEWIGDFACSHDGIASLRSGDISDGEETKVETETEGNGRLSFHWRVSSETFRNYQVDYVAFLVDGEEVDWIGGEVDWQNVAYEVTDSKKHVFTWVYRKDMESDTADGEDCAWIDEVVWLPDDTMVKPSIEGDEGATVVGDAESGFEITPSEGKTEVEITIPEGVDPEKVTVKISTNVESIKPNGAKVKIVSGEFDITDFLNIPNVDANGVIDLTKAAVKPEIVKEILDPSSKDVVIELNSENPSLTTAATRKGLKYTLREGEALTGMANGDSKVGDGNPWTPNITVKGGKSAFYSIGVGK